MTPLDAIHQLVLQTEAPLRAAIAGWGVDPSAADDIAQEAYARYFEILDHDNPADLQAQQALSTLLELAEEVHGAYLNQQDANIGELQQLLSGLSENPLKPQRAFSITEMEHLEFCLERLRADQRGLIERRYLHGERAVHIAKRLGRPPNSIRVRLLRLREWLFACLNRPMDHELPAAHEGTGQ